jgi:glycine cleavage system H protein
MKVERTKKKDLYFTDDHEWIDFQGSVAYIGISLFKLVGFKQIQELSFTEAAGFKKKGEQIATLKYNDYCISVHMPVDGKILQVNDKLVGGTPNFLLDGGESSGWIALIAPTLPHERHDLIHPKKYRFKQK